VVVVLLLLVVLVLVVLVLVLLARLGLGCSDGLCSDGLWRWRQCSRPAGCRADGRMVRYAVEYVVAAAGLRRFRQRCARLP
jgi:hypothetical protein